MDGPTVTQGAIAYAAGVDAPARAAQAALRQRAEELFGPAIGARRRVLSYLDDFVILAPPEMAEEAVATTAEALRPTGYIPSWPKLLVWHPGGPPQGEGCGGGVARTSLDQ